MTKNRFGKPKKRVIDQKKIEVFLGQIDFETEKIFQEWRHLLAFGKYKGKAAVFKLASTQITGSKTQNEYDWNEAVHLVAESDRPTLTVPKNYSSGYYGKLFYFVAEKFEEKPLAEREKIDLTKVFKIIPKIARMTFELENLPIPLNCQFVQKKLKMAKKYPIGHRVLGSSLEWARQVPREMKDYLKVVDDFKDKMRTCVGHGDFVIRQMYHYGEKIGIIDGEHSGYQGPKYYDVAQFYLRLKNDYAETDELVRKYLVEFRNLLTPADRESFWDELKPVLIQRFLGECWWNAKNEKRLDELMDFGRKILADKII